MIESELRRCTHDLQSLQTDGRAVGQLDPELQALEAEICGGGWLGVAYPHAEHGTKSYYVEGDAPLDKLALTYMVSCQSGGMYGLKVDKDAGFMREERLVDWNGGKCRLVVHSTRNKDGALEVCSVSVFKENQFLAYLFSTNDPLAFDNFNCYRGNVSNTSKPAYRSVEQMVFCDNKVRINLVMVQTMGGTKFFDAVKANARFGHDTILKVLGDQLPGLKEKIGERERVLEVIRKDEIRRFESKLNSDDKDNDKKIKKETDRLKGLDNITLKRELVEMIERYSGGVDTFYTAYLAYFGEKLSQTHDLVPFKHYKTVGRDICAVGNFLEEFERLSLMCVLTARMRQLRLSQPERLLVSALVPRCVAECSKDDGLWGYKVPPDNLGPERKLTWLASAEGDNRLFQIVDDATKFQDAYITRLSGLIERNEILEAEKFLFRSISELNTFRAEIGGLSTVPADNNPHLLGLSERLLQSLWTKQLAFPATLIRKIRVRLLQYGIGFVYYVPDLIENDQSALSIAQCIGHRCGERGDV